MNRAKELTLRAVDPKEAEPSKPKVLLYGKPGVGKTWASIDFPNVYYIDTEGGADLNHYTDKLKKAGGVYLGLEQDSMNIEVILEQVQALATQKHSYKTLVIDSITKAFNNEIAAEAERLGDGNVFGADRKPAIAMMRKLIRWIQRLDMNVVLIAHEKPEWGLNSKGERVEIGSIFDCWDKLEYELHLCLHIVKNGGMRTARIRKSRLLEFPEASSFEWSYENFAERYGKDIIKREGKTLVLATPKQIEELRSLMEIVKLPDGWEAKCLKKARVDSFDDMDSDKVEKLITFLEDKSTIKERTQ